MLIQKIRKPEMCLIGISARTNNKNEFNPETAQIPLTLQKYFQEQTASQLPKRKKPGTTYAVYTEYESDANGDYTYFLGEEVENLEDIPVGLTKLIIPEQSYTQFTSDPGVMPGICIDLWKKIWTLDPKELGGERIYTADFEIYDERAQNPSNTTLDICIAIK